MYFLPRSGRRASVLRTGEKAADSGEWDTWQWDGKTFTIHGVSPAQELEVRLKNDLTIALTGGAWFSNASFSAEGGKNIIFEGSGECLFYAHEAPDELLPFTCDPGVTFTLKDGLAITGGPDAGDDYPLTFKIGGDDGTMYDGRAYLVTSDGRKARFVRIAPGSGKGETVLQPLVLPTKFTDVSASSPYLEAIKWALEKGVTKGKTATTFGPNDRCTVSHIIYFLAGANNVEDGSDGTGVWYWAIESGLLQGNFDAYNVPDWVYNSPCTRAMAVTYLWKIAGSPAPKIASSFADVPASASYAKAVSWAVEQGITKGVTPTAFSPDAPCTRGQIVTFLYRAYSK